MDVNGTVPSDRNFFVTYYMSGEAGSKLEAARWWLGRLDLDSGEGAEAGFGGAPSREPLVKGPGVGGAVRSGSTPP
jgi:hypothetical protein